jgi:hypothetical protein
MNIMRTIAIPALGLLAFLPQGRLLADHDHGYHGYRGNVHVQRNYYYGARPYYTYGWYRPWYRPWGGPSVSVTYIRQPAVVYDNDYGTLYRGRSLTTDVQIALAKRGYYRGPIDGDIGPASRAAIRAYQVDRGLLVTGRIDGALIRALKL